MEKPKKERKKRIKAQNEKARKMPPSMLSGGKYIEQRPPMTPEERARIEAATLMILDGLFCLFVGRGLCELMRKDEFPSELDVK